MPKRCVISVYFSTTHERYAHLALKQLEAKASELYNARDIDVTVSITTDPKVRHLSVALTYGD